MRKADRIFGIVCLGISFWLIMEGARWDFIAGFTPGPGFKPIWLGIILALLSLFLIFDSYRRKESKEDTEPVFPEKHALFRVGLIVLIFAGFTLVVETLGFELTVFIFMILILYFLEEYKIGKSVFYGVAFSGSLFVIFKHWMQVDLPRGFMGF